MATKKKTEAPSASSSSASSSSPGGAAAQMQRPPAEVLHREELELLREDDEKTGSPVPPGWALSMHSVRRFILGDDALGISAKFVGNPSLVDRAMVTLATTRGLMLVGEPGTAKSLLSELLAAAVSGTSTLTIQGGASLTEDQPYTFLYSRKSLLFIDGRIQNVQRVKVGLNDRFEWYVPRAVQLRKD